MMMNDLILLIKDVLPADKSDDQHAANTLQTLVAMDFVWRPPDTTLYEPGVPRLMTYVLNNQRDPERKGDRGQAQE